MEIPVINFEASITSLNNPSLVSRVISLFELGKSSYANRIWKWGALFLALVYALGSLINKIKIIIFYFHNKSRSLLASSEPLLSHLYDEFDSSDDESDDVCSTSGSSCSDDEEEEEEMEDVWDTSFDGDDFNVKGSFCNFSESPSQKCKFKLLRRRRSSVDNFSLSELVNGNGVVKLWDRFELGVVDVNNAFSFLDFDYNNYCEKDNIVVSNGSFFGGSKSPAVFVSAGDGGGKMGLDVWDLRCRGGSAAVHSEWRSDRKGSIVGVDSGGTGKVYVRDYVTKGLAVGDVRKADAPLTEQCEEVVWWDASE